MYRSAVKEVVDTFIADKTESAEIQEGLRSASRAMVKMYDQKKITPDDVHFMELVENFCAPPGSRFYKEHGRGAIESMVANGQWDQVMEAVTHSTDFNTIFTKHIASTFIPAYESMLDDLTPFYTEVNSSERIQFHGGIIGPDEPQRVAEGGRAPESAAQSKDVQIRNEKVQRWTGITQETMLYDKTGGQILTSIRDLGEDVGRLRRRWMVTGIRDAAFTDNNMGISANTWFNYKGTAAAVFSNDHSAIDNQTNDNTASGSAITTTVLATGRNQLRAMTNFYGRKLNLAGNAILCGGDNEFAAAEIANSTGRFDSSDRTVNPVRVLGLIRNVAADSEISDGEWYYGDFKRQYVWQWVLRPETVPMGQRLDMGLIAAYLVQFIGGFGPRDYRYVIKFS